MESPFSKLDHIYYPKIALIPPVTILNGTTKTSAQDQGARSVSQYKNKL